jgi:hypothetical protein
MVYGRPLDHLLAVGYGNNVWAGTLLGIVS